MRPEVLLRGECPVSIQKAQNLIPILPKSVFETSSFNFNIWIKQDFCYCSYNSVPCPLETAPNWIYFKRANLMSIYKIIYFKSPNNEYPLYNRIASGGSISRIWILVPSRPDPVVFTSRTSSAGGWSRDITWAQESQSNLSNCIPILSQEGERKLEKWHRH